MFTNFLVTFYLWKHNESNGLAWVLGEFSLACVMISIDWDVGAGNTQVWHPRVSEYSELKVRKQIYSFLLLNWAYLTWNSETYSNFESWQWRLCGRIQVSLLIEETCSCFGSTVLSLEVFSLVLSLLKSFLTMSWLGKKTT